MDDDVSEALLWTVADARVPDDVRGMADRFGLGETLLEVWRCAFIEGWRARDKIEK